MSRICVVTENASAYYVMITRLRKAGLPFVSLVPGSASAQCDLILTTTAEAGSFDPRQTVTVEGLDENPSIFRGQIFSHLDGGKETILVGVDPGTRIGMAAYYGNAELGFDTFDSAEGLCATVAAFVKRVPARRSLVRIGNGDLPMATRLASVLAREIPETAVELVDESGTSSRGVKIQGIQGDQRAAARIALRKGAIFTRNARSQR